MDRKLGKKKANPLEIEDDLFNGVEPFTPEELAEAKLSIFPFEKSQVNPDNQDG